MYKRQAIVLDAGDTDLAYKQVLTEKEYREAYEKYGDTFRVGMGAEAVKELLQAIDLEAEAKSLQEMCIRDRRYLMQKMQQKPKHKKFKKNKKSTCNLPGNAV